MTTPVSGVALDSESVKLLRAGDVLRQEDGKEFTFRCECTEPGNLYLQEGIFWPQRAETFSFAFRPDVPALTDREGEASYRLLRRTEKIEPGDQPLNDDCKTWGDLVGWEIGAPYNPLLMVPVRRALLNGADR